MATTPSTTKAKPDNQNLTRNRSIGRKPKEPSSVSSEDGSAGQKPEKPLPNYLKPTISSRPDPVKFLKKNNNSLDDNQKLLRRRSFDRPPSSLTSPSTSSSHIQKSLNASPSLPRDRPAVPREKPVTAQRSSSFHGTRGVPRGGITVKSPHVAPKKSGMGSSSTSSQSKKEGSGIKKTSEKEIPLDSASLSSAQEDEEEILKVESDLKVADDIEEPKDVEKETKEVQVEVVVEADEENESGRPTTVASPVAEDCIGVVVAKEDEKKEEELINEDKTEEKIEETNEQEKNQDRKGEEEEEVNKKIDDEDETLEKVDIDMNESPSSKETSKEKEEEDEEKEKVKDEETTKEKEDEVKEEEKEAVKEEEKEKVNEEEKEKVKEEEAKKRPEVVKGKKESPSAYNDVIASKIQENPRKNKVLALAGAFQTVIDYETAASK